MTKEKAELARALGEELAQKLSNQSLAIHEAVAARLGLNITDYKCLELAQRASHEGIVTAGRLAELTGLTTGAITGVLDRLERAGFVRREKAPEDRRQVHVRLLPERTREIEAQLAPFQAAFLDLCAQYKKDELALLADFARRYGELLARSAGELRDSSDDERGSERGEEHSAPLDGAQQGTLEISRGASNLVLGGLRGKLLYRLRSEGPLPQVSASHGRVVVEYGRSGLRMFDFRRHALNIELNDKIPWELSLRGGVNKLHANLRAITLSRFELSGGVSDATVELPHPVGSVSVRIAGGANKLRVLRPKDAPARLYVKSGVSGLTIDTLRLGSVGGDTRWQSPDFEGASDRYEIEVLGGASDLSIAYG